jgi:hypothetical protein
MKDNSYVPESIFNCYKLSGVPDVLDPEELFSKMKQHMAGT